MADTEPATRWPALGRPQVLVLDRIAYEEMNGSLRNELASNYHTTLLWREQDPDTHLERHGARYLGLVNRSGLTAALLDKLSNLQIITQTGVGVEGLPLAEIARREIVLTNAGDAVSDDVADIAIALMLCVFREIPWAEDHARSGRWLTQRPRIARSASNRSYGILGMGRTGSAIARRLLGFGGSIAYHSRHPDPDSPAVYTPDPKELARRSDCLFVALPGGARDGRPRR